MYVKDVYLYLCNIYTIKSYSGKTERERIMQMEKTNPIERRMLCTYSQSVIFFCRVLS